MIDGVTVAIDREAVVVTAARGPLAVVSSAVVGGGFLTARATVNFHVPKTVSPDDVERMLEAYVRRRAIAPPYVGLLTSAWTEKAAVAEVSANGIDALAVVTVGLSNPVAAGWTDAAVASASTINAIVVDADPEAAALVNAVMTVTEVKTMVMVETGIRCSDGRLASGTSTDAVVIAATGRGSRCRFGGPISDLGGVVATATREAMGAGVRRSRAEHA